MNMDFKRKLTIPYDLKKEYPVTVEMAEVFDRRDRELKAILSGQDSRLALIIGPCSADREDSGAGLHFPAGTHPGAGEGPDPDRPPGLHQQATDHRRRATRACSTSRTPTASPGYAEGPDRHPEAAHAGAASRQASPAPTRCSTPENYKYLADVLAYVAVGARSVEDQQHRLISSAASGRTRRHEEPHRRRPVRHDELHQCRPAPPYLHLSAAGRLHTTGNPYAHAILRGYAEQARRRARPNYHYEDLMFLYAALRGAAASKIPPSSSTPTMPTPARTPSSRAALSREVLHSTPLRLRRIRSLVKGFMVESYL